MAAVIEVEAVVTRFGAQTVHDGVGFTVERGTLAPSACTWPMSNA